MKLAINSNLNKGNGKMTAEAEIRIVTKPEMVCITAETQEQIDDLNRLNIGANIRVISSYYNTPIDFEILEKIQVRILPLSKWTEFRFKVCEIRHAETKNFDLTISSSRIWINPTFHLNKTDLEIS